MNIKPQRNVDSTHEALRHIREQFDLLRKTCLTCHLFNEANEICTKFNQRPPARVIANGCQHWDDIPF